MVEERLGRYRVERRVLERGEQIVLTAKSKLSLLGITLLTSTLAALATVAVWQSSSMTVSLVVSYLAGGVLLVVSVVVASRLAWQSGRLRNPATVTLTTAKAGSEDPPSAIGLCVDRRDIARDEIRHVVVVTYQGEEPEDAHFAVEVVTDRLLVSLQEYWDEKAARSFAEQIHQWLGLETLDAVRFEKRGIHEGPGQADIVLGLLAGFVVVLPVSQLPPLLGLAWPLAAGCYAALIQLAGIFSVGLLCSLLGRRAVRAHLRRWYGIGHAG